MIPVQFSKDSPDGNFLFPPIRLGVGECFALGGPGFVDHYCIGPVNIKDAVQVVTFVLEYDGRITLHLFGDGGAVRFR